MIFFSIQHPWILCTSAYLFFCFVALIATWHYCTTGYTTSADGYARPKDRLLAVAIFAEVAAAVTVAAIATTAVVVAASAVTVAAIATAAAVVVAAAVLVVVVAAAAVLVVVVATAVDTAYVLLLFCCWLWRWSPC